MKKNFWIRREGISWFDEHMLRRKVLLYFTSPSRGKMRSKYLRYPLMRPHFQFQLRKEQERRSRAMDEIVRISEEAGLYDQV